MRSFLDNCDKLKDQGTIISKDIIKIGKSSYLIDNPFGHFTELCYIPKKLEEKEMQRIREMVERDVKIERHLLGVCSIV